jgi:hypothetical protein
MSALPPLEPQFPGSTPTPLNYARPLPVHKRTDLRQIAVRQKAIQFCILGYLVSVVLLFILPRPLRVLGAFGVLATVKITAAVFVFMLAMAIYGTALGIILGVMTLIPVVGLIVLLIVNGKATSLLRDDGIHVGLLGARMSDLDGWV